MNCPIVIMSFNRPKMLASVLDSLLAQEGVEVRERPIHLFQDGAVNRYSRLRYAQDEDISECVKVFREKMPGGIVHESAFNIGVCENFKRAEEFLFVELGADCGYFFEDDLELAPAYLSMMDIIGQWALSVEDVAYFAAYGDYYASEEIKYINSRQLANLDHHWGFGLVGRHWRSMQPILRNYYGVILGADYNRRDHRAVMDLYSTERISPRATSQDSAKALACAMLGLARCNTVTSFAKYIGSSGVHMTAEAYNAMGYANTTVRSSPVENLRFPDDSARRALVASQIELYECVKSNEFQSIMDRMAPRQYNPARMCTRADVFDGYTFFLCRNPESDHVVEDQVGRHCVAEFIGAVVKSKEFIELKDSRLGKAVDEKSIARLYQLLLHRDPDIESLEARISGGYDVRQVARAIIDSAEFRGLEDSFVLR